MGARVTTCEQSVILYASLSAITNVHIILHTHLVTFSTSGPSPCLSPMSQETKDKIITDINSFIHTVHVRTYIHTYTQVCGAAVAPG